MNLKRPFLFFNRDRNRDRNRNCYDKSVLREIDTLFYLKCIQHGCLCSVGFVLNSYWNVYGICAMLAGMYAGIELEIRVHNVFEQTVRPQNIHRSLLNIAQHIKCLQHAQARVSANPSSPSFPGKSQIHYPSMYRFLERIAYYEKVQCKETLISTVLGLVGFITSISSYAWDSWDSWYSWYSWYGHAWICLCLCANLACIRLTWRTLDNDCHDCYVAREIEQDQLKDIQNQIVSMFHYQEAIHHNDAYYIEFMGLSPLFRNLERIRQTRRKKVHRYVYTWMPTLCIMLFLNISCLLLIPTVYFGYNWFYLLISIYYNIYRYLQYKKDLNIYNHQVDFTLDRYGLPLQVNAEPDSTQAKISVHLNHFPDGAMELKLFRQVCLVDKNRDVMVHTQRHTPVIHKKMVDQIYKHDQRHPGVIIDHSLRTMVPGNIGFNVAYGSSYVIDAKKGVAVEYRKKSSYGEIVDAVLKTHDLYAIRNMSIHVFGKQSVHPIYQNITLARAYLRSLDHARHSCPIIWILHLYTQDVNVFERHLKQIQFLKNFNRARVVFALSVSLDRTREKILQRYFPDITDFYID